MRGQGNVSPMNILLGLVILLASFIILYTLYVHFAGSSTQAIDTIIFGAFD